MPSPKIVYGALAAITFVFLTPNPALATDYTPGRAVPIDLEDDSNVLTAHASIPDAAGGPVDDACRAAASASNEGNGGTIVVCSHGGDGSSQRVPPSKSVDESTDTGALHPPDVSGLPGCIGPCITIPFGHVPPPVYYIDLSKIPQAPVGSDAWKIAQGLIRAP